MMTKPFYGNCILSAAYLLLRLKACSVVIAKGKPWPPHLMIGTRRGYFHFDWDPTEGTPPPGVPPWWFRGRIVGVRRGRLFKAMADRKRRYKGTCKFPNVFLIGMLLVFAFIVPPWIVGWAAYAALDLARGAGHALTKRRKFQ